MNQGCPNEGKDRRLFGRWGCRIQAACSWHSERPPLECLVSLFLRRGWPPYQASLRFPPYLGICVPLTPSGRFFSLRIGCRWDPNWAFEREPWKTGGYIVPEAIVKVTDHPLV